MDSAPDPHPAPRRSSPLGGLSSTLSQWARFGAGARVDVEPSPIDDSHRRALDAARHYRHLYYSAPVALVSCDVHGTVLRWNDRADAGFADRLRKGRVNTLAMLMGDAPADALLNDIGSGGHHARELRVPGPGGPERVWAIEASAVGDAVEISLVDVSERSRTADALEHMAHHDVLTERLNRRGLERRLDVLLAAGDTPAAVVYVDLDRFKAINDVFGHATGDAVVVEVAQRLDAVLPDTAALARIGGDEFVAVLPGLDLEAAHRVAIEMLESLTSAPCLADGLRLDVEASLGVVEVAAPMRTREVIALADEACATSKRGGRGRITAVMPDEDTLDALRESVRLGSMLKTRLPVERMRLYAQPIVPLRVAYTPLSYEILLRTTGEDGRIEGPARLLDAAERHGGMPAIDRFVLERTLEHLAANPAHAESAEFFAVNLSGPSLNDERFVRDAVAMLRSHPTLARKLCLEITEAVAVYDLRGARRFIDAFLDTGATVALDDFGAGYTSFAYLKHLPASLIKIDGQFVVGLERDPRQRGIVQAIARLAHELDMRCLAEWVEAPATLRALLELDVDYAQGYLFDRPAAIDAWLERPVNLAPLKAAREGAAA